MCIIVIIVIILSTFNSLDGISLECLVVDVSEDEMSSVEVSWTMQNETFCIHLEAAPIHSVEITLEATDENSSLIASLASVKLPLVSRLLVVQF